jgi:hypothetical protein
VWIGGLALTSVGVAIWAAFAAVERKRQQQALLRQIATFLGGRHDATAAFGSREGAVVRFQLTTRGVGKSKEWWTEFDVVVPAAYPLAIHVRRHRWLDHARVARGGVVVLPLGDPQFDDAFLVEAAPEDIARKLLDAAVCSFLSALRRAELDTVAIGESKVLRLALQGRIDDFADATSTIDFLVGIAGRIRDVYAAIDGAVPVQVGGSPYRPQLGVVGPVHGVPAVRAVEVAPSRRRARAAPGATRRSSWRS